MEEQKKEESKKPLPPLKAGVEALPVEHEGKQVIMLRDTEGLTEKSLGVSLPGFMVASMLNGQVTAEELRDAFNQSTGSVLTSDDIQNVVDQLDQVGLLETDTLKEKRRKIYEEFAEDPIRKPHLMKSGYPADRLELASFLGPYFKDSKGPNKEFAASPEEAAPPIGLIAPHIDFLRGGPVYAWSYQELSRYPKPDVIVALGVSHVSPNSPWIMSRKKFDTPYGMMDVDESLYDKISKTLWYDGRADEWVHRTEHSLEFQALWLKYLWKDESPKWVPILCSSFERYCTDQSPSKVPTVEDAINKIGAVLNAYQKEGKRVMLLAGVDLAHVGSRFGDEFKVDAELKAKLEKEDRESMAELLSMDPDKFFLSVIKDKNWRKWCGLSTLYTFIRLLKAMSPDKPIANKLLAYDQSDDPAGGVVSYMGAIFTK